MLQPNFLPPCPHYFAKVPVYSLVLTWCYNNTLSRWHKWNITLTDVIKLWATLLLSHSLLPLFCSVSDFLKSNIYHLKFSSLGTACTLVSSWGLSDLSARPRCLCSTSNAGTETGADSTGLTVSPWSLSAVTYVVCTIVTARSRVKVSAVLTINI